MTSLISYYDVTFQLIVPHYSLIVSGSLSLIVCSAAKDGGASGVTATNTVSGLMGLKVPASIGAAVVTSLVIVYVGGSIYSPTGSTISTKPQYRHGMPLPSLTPPHYTMYGLSLTRYYTLSLTRYYTPLLYPVTNPLLYPVTNPLLYPATIPCH